MCGGGEGLKGLGGGGGGCLGVGGNFNEVFKVWGQQNQGERLGVGEIRVRACKRGGGGGAVVCDGAARGQDAPERDVTASDALHDDALHPKSPSVGLSKRRRRRMAIEDVYQFLRH